MGELEDGKEASSFSALKLETLQIPFTGAMDSPEHPSTPPFQASAAVPFKWEEQPGKPRPCSDAIARPPAKSLELPPCMADVRFTKTPSPTTVFDGPYPKFSSFRLFRDAHAVHSAIDGSPEGTAFDSLLKSAGSGVKSRGFFGKFKGGKRELYGGGSCRFSPSSVSSSCDSDERFAAVKNNCGVKLKITRNGSFSTIPSHAKPSHSQSQSHLWTSIYQGIKQVMQWKSSKKSNKQGRD